MLPSADTHTQQDNNWGMLTFAGDGYGEGITYGDREISFFHFSFCKFSKTYDSEKDLGKIFLSCSGVC